MAVQHLPGWDVPLLTWPKNRWEGAEVSWLLCWVVGQKELEALSCPAVQQCQSVPSTWGHHTLCRKLKVLLLSILFVGKWMETFLDAFEKGNV